MRYRRLIQVLAAGVFLIGIFSITVAFAKKPPKPPSELEQRVTTLEGQTADQEIRIDGLETNDAAQGSQLADHETRIINLEQQVPPLPGVQVSDDSGQYLGILLGMKEIAEIFIPELNVATVIRESAESSLLGTADIHTPGINVLFAEGNCTGSAYLSAGQTQCDKLYRFGSLVNPPRYFYGIQPQNRDITASSQMGNDGNCVNNPVTSAQGYQAIEILSAEIPFNLPVDLPLRYEVQ